MFLGPVFKSEMITTARRTRYFLVRVLFGSLLLLCLWGSYEGTNYQNNSRLTIQQSAELAGAFFQTFAWSTLIVALLATPAMVAGAVATERERRTIEYLFATDLSNSEIILSKLVSRLLLVGKLLVVSIPILAIFRMLGGIPASTLFTYFAGLASTIVLLATTSIAISVWTPRARDAVIRVYLVVALAILLPVFVLVPLGITAFAGGGGGWWFTLLSKLTEGVLAINPLYILGTSISMSGVGIGTRPVWMMVGIHLAMSLALALMAVLAVRRVHLRAVSTPGTSREKRRRWGFPQYRPPVGDWPMLWKECIARTSTTRLGILGRVALLLLIGLTFVIHGLIYYQELENLFRANSYGDPGDWLIGSTTTITGFFGSGLVLLAGLRAAGLIANEKEHDSWISLISTPLESHQIIWGKAWGNLYAFRWMLLPLGVAWLMQVTLSPHYMIAIPMQLVALIATVFFATGVGLFYSLKFASSVKAIGATLGTLIFVGGGYAFCCCLPMFFAAGPGDEMVLIFMACIPLIQAVPGPLVFEGFDGGGEWSMLLIDYLFGTFGYAVAGAVIVGSLVQNFDLLAGRTSRDRPSRPSPPPPPTTPPPPTQTTDPFPVV